MGKTLEDVFELMVQMHARMDGFEQRMDGFEQRMDRHEELLTGLIQMVGQTNTRLDDLEKKVETLQSNMNEQFKKVHTDAYFLSKKVWRNERNIFAVAKHIGAEAELALEDF